ncbi:MAG: AsmA family protein [Deltaproteobacteria bacterium ADurb.Bin022]|jgi:flagellar motor protein MotB|nr:MAG: AsmA family protein [Deltaproteobacteria bacterium ADurb.Bin022]
MRILKKIAIGLLIFLVVLGIAGFFIAPPLVKPYIMKKMSEALHRKASIEKVSINPYALSITLKKFSLEDPGKPKPFVAFDELYVNADLISSLFRRALILRQITLTNPYVGISRKPDGSYNFSDLLPKDEEKPKPDKEENPFLFSLNNIQIINGNIDFEDAPKKTNHTVREFNVSVPFISNIEYHLEKYVEPKFSTNINNNKFELAGKTQPFLTSRATSFDINIQDIDIPYYLNYVPAKMNCQLKSARLDTNIKLNFIVNEDKSPALTLNGNVVLRDVILDDLKNNKILHLPSLNVNMTSVEPFVSNIHLARIAIESPELVIRRDKEGEINLLNLTKKQAEKLPQKEAAAASKKKSGFKFRVDDVLLYKADIIYMDSQPSDPVKLHFSPLSFKAANLSTEKGATGKVELEGILNKKGEFKDRVTLTLEPLSVDVQSDWKNIGIRAFQPYFTDKVKMDITRGTISSTGNFSLSRNKKNELVIKCTGSVSVSNLAALDKAQSNDFLKFKRLSLDKIKFGYNPFSLSINTISLADFYTRIIINPDASLNVQDIFGDNQASKETAIKKEEKKPVTAETKKKDNQETADIKIGKVVFKNGHIDFSDNNIQPNYSANMFNLTGSVTGLSSKEFSRADVALKGNLGYGSPIEIAGKINPLAKDLFVDLKVGFKDIELSPITPYSNKFLGYPITKGKLTFNVSYLIDKRKLDSQNKVLIDQLTFGEKVESPQAVKAPVTLAATLLTDRNGQINLDLPVSGSLDDPKFKVWSVIWQIIVNLITKAVTSPFALLSSLTGGGEELSFIEFDYGSAVISAEETKKISMIGKALNDRPNIKLDIEGYVDAEQDKYALKKAELDRRIKAQKMKETMSKDDQQIAVENVVLTEQEYDKYLKQVYRSADFSKPRNILGMQKTLPPAEMEKLMLASIEVTDSDLRQLAARRAQNVKELMLQSDIAADRIFIVESKSLTPEKKEKVKNSRADFKLK